MVTQVCRLGPAMLALVLVLGISSSAALAQAADPLVGVWVANVAKSKFDPGPPWKSATIRFEPAQHGHKYTSDVVNADGTTEHVEYTASYDGKDYPVEGAKDYDTVSLRRIDASTFERTNKKDGKVVSIVKRKIAADGKAFTATVTGTNVKGQSLKNVVVWERQSP